MTLAGVRLTMEELSPAAHVAETVDQLSRVYQEHSERTSSVQRLANSVTAALGRPSTLIAIVGLILAWVVGNYVAHRLGSTALEEFPFPDLEFVATVTALVVALLILTTQRHQDELAERRARLTLQIAVLSEKKVAKVIELLEEQRRDNPLLPSRRDGLAEEMAQPADASADLADGQR